MATKKTQPIGAVLENVHIQNQAASVSPEAANALAEAARASAEHGKALAAIANALKGAEAHMQYGIHLSDMKGS